MLKAAHRVRACSLVFKIAGLFLCSQIAFGQEESLSIETLRSLYSDFGGLILVAQNKHADSFIRIAVGENGAYSQSQYDKDLYAQIYRQHRDVEAEWDSIPAHFVYYDGNLRMISAASFDPAGMYDDVSLEGPLALGEKFPVLSCIWPVMGTLMDSGKIEPNELGSWTLGLENVLARVVFDREGFIREVVWGENGEGTVLIGRWEYSGYGQGDNPLLPTEMTQTYMSADQQAKNAINSVAHYAVKFDRNQEHVEKALRFIDSNEEYARRDFKTHDVYDSVGTLLYNENEMTEEYLAALGRGNPKRTRWILLTVLGVGVVGSVWALRKRVV